MDVSDFSDSSRSLVREDEPLAPFCWLKIGGSARFFAEPGSIDALTALCKDAHNHGLPLRVLGGGSNLLVRPQRVDALVLRLIGDFAQTKIEGNRLIAGGGAVLGEVLATAAAAGLAGLEGLAGIPGSVGGAVVNNSGAINEDIGCRVQVVRAVTKEGEPIELKRDGLQFGFRHSNLDGVIVTEVELELETAEPAEITRRLQAAWIVKKAAQPSTGARTAQAFVGPGGYSIAELLDAAGMRTASVGEAAMSSQFPGYLVVNENVTADDVLALTTRIARAVEVQSGIQLHSQLKIW